MTGSGCSGFQTLHGDRHIRNPGAGNILDSSRDGRGDLSLQLRGRGGQRKQNDDFIAHCGKWSRDVNQDREGRFFPKRTRDVPSDAGQL